MICMAYVDSNFQILPNLVQSNFVLRLCSSKEFLVALNISYTSILCSSNGKSLICLLKSTGYPSKFQLKEQ